MTVAIQSMRVGTHCSFFFAGLLRALQLDRVMEVDRVNKHYSAVVSSQESIAHTMNVDTDKVYVALDEKGNQSYIGGMAHTTES